MKYTVIMQRPDRDLCENSYIALVKANNFRDAINTGLNELVEAMEEEGVIYAKDDLHVVACLVGHPKSMLQDAEIRGLYR